MSLLSSIRHSIHPSINQSITTSTIHSLCTSNVLQPRIRVWGITFVAGGWQSGWTYCQRSTCQTSRSPWPLTLTSWTTLKVLSSWESCPMSRRLKLWWRTVWPLLTRVQKALQGHGVLEWSMTISSSTSTVTNVQRRLIKTRAKLTIVWRPSRIPLEW